MSEWSSSRFTYTKAQVDWIEKVLKVNGMRVSAVLDMMTDAFCGFPNSDCLKTFKDAAQWACLIERIAKGDAETFDTFDVINVKE